MVQHDQPRCRVQQLARLQAKRGIGRASDVAVSGEVEVLLAEQRAAGPQTFDDVRHQTAMDVAHPDDQVVGGRG